jgi:hypothetical protein
MLDIRGFQKTKLEDGWLFEAYPSYCKSTLVIYGRNGAAISDKRKLPIALISLQSKSVHYPYESIQGRIQTEKDMELYTYVYQEQEADLQIVYANLLPEGSGDMKFRFRLEPNNTGYKNFLLNKITVLPAGQNYTMSSSDFGTDIFSSIRIQTKHSLLKTMGETPKENLTNEPKYDSIKQQLIFDLIPSKSISKYFACGLEVSVTDGFFVRCKHMKDRSPPSDDEVDSPRAPYDDVVYMADNLDVVVDDSDVVADGPPSDVVDGGSFSDEYKDEISNVRVPKNKQYLAEIRPGKRAKRPYSIDVIFNPQEELALWYVMITLTGTNVKKSSKFTRECAPPCK